MNKFDYKNLTPFKWFVLENFPFIEADFDALTEWQLFCKLGKEINKIIDSQNLVGEQAETLTNAFNNLKNYVDNYFENLDVQEEINNKLNEMAEDGTLQNILMDYTSIQKIYNTCQEMIEDEHLIKNMKIKTLGFYSINDGGGATYFIREKTDFDVIDNGSLHDLSNGLVAELIVENNIINVKQFGAKGDGIADDTNSIKNAISFLRRIFNKRNMSTYKMLGFESGNYVVSSQISIPVYIKINVTGNVVIISNVTAGATIWINSENFIDYPDTELDIFAQTIYRDGPIIGGDGILLLQRNNGRNDINNLSATSIGIEIGDRTRLQDALVFGDTTFENIAVRNFACGIKLNSKNTYLMRFNRCSLERNRVDFQYGETDMTTDNSGENITFNECIFGQSYNAFINYAACNLNFNNCSFDFNGNIFLNKQASNLSFVNCHFECVGFHQKNIVNSSIDNTEGFGCIIYNSYVPKSETQITTVTLLNPDFYLADSPYTTTRFKSTPNTFPNTLANNYYKLLNINFINIQYFIESGYSFENLYIVDENTSIKQYSTPHIKSTMIRMPSQNDENGKFVTIPETDVNIDNLDRNYLIQIQNFDSASINDEDKFFYKSIDLSMNNKRWGNVIKRLDNPTTKKIATTIYFKPLINTQSFDHFQISLKFLFFNSANIYSGTPQEFTLPMSHIQKDPNSNWYNIRPYECEIPNGTQYLKLDFSFVPKNGDDQITSVSGNLLIGGIITNFIN